MTHGEAPVVIGPVDAYGDGSCDWSLGDDFDGVVEMPDDGPLMEITLMVPCMDDDDL